MIIWIYDNRLLGLEATTLKTSIIVHVFEALN